EARVARPVNRWPRGGFREETSASRRLEAPPAAAVGPAVPPAATQAGGFGHRPRGGGAPGLGPPAGPRRLPRLVGRRPGRGAGGVSPPRRRHRAGNAGDAAALGRGGVSGGGRTAGPGAVCLPANAAAPVARHAGPRGAAGEVTERLRRRGR